MKKTIFILLLTILLAGCKTKMMVITVPEVRTDTCFIIKEQRDSIWHHDSIYVSEKQKGDTIYLWQERWHTKYIEKNVHDTTYISRTDSVPVPYPVTEYVEKQLSWWQVTRITVGTLAMIAMLVWCVWQGAKLYMKRF